MSQYEDCPHCKGTGRRLVVPWVKKRAPQGSGPSHGRASIYQRGCRCDLCRAAWRDYARNWRRQRKAS